MAIMEQEYRIGANSTLENEGTINLNGSNGESVLYGKVKNTRFQVS